MGSRVSNGWSICLIAVWLNASQCAAALPWFTGQSADSSLLQTTLAPPKISPVNIWHEAPAASSDQWIEQISWNPRAYIYHNFLTDEEAENIIKMARPFMKRSTVVASDGKSGVDDIRTSYGAFLKRLNGSLITSLEERLQAWTGLPIVNQEDLQVLRYGVGQKYGAHYDSLSEESPRIATALFYLKDTNLTGGETAFPVDSEWIGGSKNRDGDFSECAKGHVAAKAKKGDALLFYSLNPDGKQDKHSMHTGCPVVNGVKWTATKWIHTKPFRPLTLYRDTPEERVPDYCQNEDSRCSLWASTGECEKNPDFMKGISGRSVGLCRLACKACEVCTEGDIACFNRNRASLSYLGLDAA